MDGEVLIGLSPTLESSCYLTLTLLQPAVQPQKPTSMALFWAPRAFCVWYLWSFQ